MFLLFIKELNGSGKNGGTEDDLASSSLNLGEEL